MKINRLQMAENTPGQQFDVSEAIGKSEQFINQNKKSLTILMVALLVAVGGYFFYTRIYVAGKEKEAQAVLFRAEQYFNADSLRLAINGDGNNPGLEEIVSDYSMSPSGNLARYYLGMAYLKQKEFQKAIDMLQSYDANDEVTGSLATAAIGDAYLEIDNKEKAISQYEKAAKMNPNNFTTPLFMFKWAGALEMNGNYKEAVSVYERIKKEYPTTPEGTQVDKYLARANALAGM